MKAAVAVSVMGLFLAGCAWTPDRDNAHDPDSPYFELPPPPNRAPVIGAVRVTTDSRQEFEITVFYAFEASCTVTDPDNNLYYDSVRVRLDTVALGFMQYDPSRKEFVILRTEVDLDVQDFTEFRNDTVWVEARDDSHAVSRAFTQFPATTSPPQILFPRTVWFDSVYTSYPALRWYSGSRPGDSYSVRVLFEDIFVVWDTSGLPTTVDSVVVTDSLWTAAATPSVFYSWYLTVTDEHGQRATGLPGLFKVYVPPPHLKETGPLADARLEPKRSE
jgi:hypothetical protein